jgi:hypothetical protein
MAETGIRVPFNTHAPLTLPGTLSTAGHCDQSRAAIEQLRSEHNVESHLLQRAQKVGRLTPRVEWLTDVGQSPEIEGSCQRSEEGS